MSKCLIGSIHIYNLTKINICLFFTKIMCFSFHNLNNLSNWRLFLYWVVFQLGSCVISHSSSRCFQFSCTLVQMNRSWIYISERKKHCFPSSEKFNDALSVNLKPGRKSVDNFARTSSGSLVPILVVFSATLIKCPDRKHLRKKRFIRANGSIIHSTRVGGCGGRSSAHVVILSLSSGHTES